jgi:hypothetical protein
MRKLLILLASLGSLATLTFLALPAASEPKCAGCSVKSADAPLDLGAIPMKPINGHQSIQGISIGDESDDMPTFGSDGANLDRPLVNAEDNGTSHEGLDEDD